MHGCVVRDRSISRSIKISILSCSTYHLSLSLPAYMLQSFMYFISVFFGVRPLHPSSAGSCSVLPYWVKSPSPFKLHSFITYLINVGYNSGKNHPAAWIGNPNLTSPFGVSEISNPSSSSIPNRFRPVRSFSPEA